MEIITVKNIASFSQDVVLDGNNYRIEFNYNQRGDHWSMSVYTRENDPIVQGITIVKDYDLFGQYRAYDLPPGQLYAIDITETYERVERQTFLSPFQLVYITEAELAQI